MLKTLNKCEWKDIEINEVFARDGCIQIFCKTSEDDATLLDIDYNHIAIGYAETGKETQDMSDNWSNPSKSGELYKLPLSVQRLWRCDK